ncbi:MAG TPA: RDD family protein [Candidatus Baltobacteraceae bacterium]
MDRDVDIRTPESVAFRYELAGLGSRFLAVFVDLLIQVAVILLIFWGLTYLASHASPAVVRQEHQDSWAQSIGIAIVVAIVFTIFYGYFILFEIFWNGQTPGKKLLGIRVVRDGGYPVDFGASFLRNVIRIGEQLLLFYALSAVSTLLSPENKRVGDYAAGTIVVRESRFVPIKNFLRALPQPASVTAASLLGDEERALIANFLERRDQLSGDRRRDLALRIAARVRPRVPAALASLEDEELLERLS